MIRVIEIEPPKAAVVHAPVVHTPVVHAKRKAGVYRDLDARRAYKADHERKRRALARAGQSAATL
jgi:hypothetical protein